MEKKLIQLTKENEKEWLKNKQVVINTMLEADSITMKKGKNTITLNVAKDLIEMYLE